VDAPRAVDWFTHGLILPKAVTEATTEYFDNQDVIAQWMEECCDVDQKNPHLMEKTMALFTSWSSFAQAHGEMIGTTAMFKDNLAKRGIKSEQIKALRTKGCRGIRLKYTSSWQDR
jgi:putative DNA primase/helicase